MSKYILFIFRILISVLLLQTPQYKFTAHTDSVYIFRKVGLEPFGRLGIGVLEFIAADLILIPKTIWISGVLTFIILGCAIIYF